MRQESNRSKINQTKQTHVTAITNTTLNRLITYWWRGREEGQPPSVQCGLLATVTVLVLETRSPTADGKMVDDDLKTAACRRTAKIRQYVAAILGNGEQYQSVDVKTHRNVISQFQFNICYLKDGSPQRDQNISKKF
ncbi:hypothetical protein J6590_050824 [Homalodisca vitripennis]|nr:hypothetical protein J6590_050824 [Homalodisca vitripennis]